MDPIPRPPSRLFGRDDDVARLVARLQTGRWVTLTGLGGVGKTRLAMAVGAAFEDAGTAVAYCDAVGLRAIDELGPAVADALGMDALPGDSKGQTPRWVAALARQKQAVLLVLDNVEQLAARAGEVLGGWLARVPDLRLLVTSRVALAKPDELVVPVLPIGADRHDSPAVALLMERANAPEGSAWREDRAALQRLAVRLDGIPLALELAAGRAAFSSPDILVALLGERLSLGAGDRDPLARGASRDAAVAWSWGELPAVFRAALGRLAVVAGSFDLELAAAVIGGSRVASLEAIEVLSRHSLLVSEPAPRNESAAPAGPRHRLLETVRDFALAQTAPEHLDAARDALAETLLARVEPQLSAFSRALPPEVSSLVARDRDLFLGVMRRGLSDPRPLALTHALRVASAVVPLFQRAGFGRVATGLAMALLEGDEIENTPLAARLGAAMVTVVGAAGEADAAASIDLLVARLSAWLAVGGDALLIRGAVGIIHYYRWDLKPLLALAESALRSEVAARSPELVAYASAAQVSARRGLGLAVLAEDDARLVAASARLGPRDVAASALVELTRAFLATQLGDPTRGLGLATEGQLRARAAGLGWFEALNLLERGRALADLGRMDEAAAVLGEAVQGFDPKSAVRERQETELDRALVALIAGRYDEVQTLLARTATTLETRFERAFHTALKAAFGALVGRPEGATLESTGSVEDGACLALTALGRKPEDVAAARVEVAAAAGHSFRARLALELLDAGAALSEGVEGAAIAIATDGTAFRAGRAWVDLASRPLAMRLAMALAEARLTRRGDSIARDELAEVLWPDERMSPASRDQRLHTAVSALRKLGLDALELHAGGYRLDPARALVRVSAAAWPGPQGEFQRARGRGRPRTRE